MQTVLMIGEDGEDAASSPRGWLLLIALDFDTPVDPTEFRR